MFRVNSPEVSDKPLLEVGRPLGVHRHLYGSNMTAVETKAGQLTQPQGPKLPGFAWLVELKEDMPGTLPSLEQNAHNKQHRGDKSGPQYHRFQAMFILALLFGACWEAGHHGRMCAGTEWPGNKRDVSSNKPSRA